MDTTDLVLLLASLSGAGPAPICGPAAIALVTHQQADINKAVPLGRWANAQDVARLQAVEGKPRWMVLLILGHPSAVERHADGVEVWDYPWFAVCRVWFKNGVCTGTFYSAGY